MLQIRSEPGPLGGLHAVVVVCDHCADVIGDATGALYAWRVDRRTLDVQDASMVHLHKRCVRLWEAQHGGSHQWFTAPLCDLPLYLGNTLGLDWLAALERNGMAPRGWGLPATGRPEGEAWRLVRQLIFLRDGYTCAYCHGTYEASYLEVDHRTPVSRNGTNDIENLVTACRPCNRSKHDKTDEEWRGAEAEAR